VQWIPVCAIVSNSQRLGIETDENISPHLRKEPFHRTFVSSAQLLTTLNMPSDCFANGEASGDVTSQILSTSSINMTPF
jgi:hypothetical protein